MARKIEYLLPSFAHALFVILLLSLSLNFGQKMLVDCDTGFHIRAGEFMLQTRSIPKDDPFSLFSPPMPFPTHEWLSDVLMALVAKASGLSGVVLFFIFMVSVAYSAFFRILRANKGNILVDIFLIVLVLTTSQMHWLARPHMFTLAFLMGWYSIVDSFQNDRSNLLFFLPPIMLAWVNLHGGFIIGFITILVYLLHNILMFRRSEGPEKGIHARKARDLLLVTLASAVFSLANPKGFHTLLFPFDVVSNRLIMDNYIEFLSPNFHNVPFNPFRCFLLLMIAFFAASRVKLVFYELALVLVFVNMSLYSARYIPLFAVAVAPILSKHGTMALHRSKYKIADLAIRKSSAQESIDESAKGYVWPVVAVLLVLILAATDRITFRFDEATKPVAAVEFLKNDHIPGNMYNNDEFGDYIIYRSYPQYKVFFDGRADIYGNEILQEYMDVANMKTGWENILRKYDINWIIFNTESALSKYLLVWNDWKLVYSDNVASIYVRNIPRNGPIIKKYGKNISRMMDNP